MKTVMKKATPGTGALAGLVALMTGLAAATPTIVTQPSTQVAAVGATVTFSVEATGVPPLTYQWLAAPNGKQPAEIPGATESELIVESAPEGIWLYQVAVTDAEGTTLSAIARLVGLSPPILATGPFDLTLAPGEDITLRVSLTDGAPPFRYQWQFEGADIEGETRSSLNLSGVQAEREGEYSVEVSNNVGSASGVVARLHPGSPAFSLINDDPVVIPAAASSPGNWGDYDGDGYPDLYVQGSGLYHNEGNDNAWLVLKLVGTASNRDAIGAWVEATAMIAGEEITQTRHTTSGVYRGQGDSRIHFGLGDATKIDRLRIEWPSGTVQELADVDVRQILEVTEILPAEISVVQQPESMAVAEGRPAKLFAKISGPKPVSYQWQHDGEHLPGETGRILYLPSVGPEDAGDYRLVVSAEGHEPVITAAAVLTVNPPPTPGPHEFTDLWIDRDGIPHFSLAGEAPPGFLDIFAVDASEDLKTWQALPPAVSDNGTAVMIDSDYRQQRFFRAFRNGFWTPYPAPDGPHAVGTFRRQVTNSTGSRKLMATVWYPATRDVSQAPASWFEPDYVEHLTKRFGPGMKVLDQVRGHSIPGLALSDAQTAWPALILSHAFMGHREDNRDLAETLASHGYVVISANHRDAEFTQLEDGTVVTGTGNLWDNSVLNQRMPEVRILLDVLEDWNVSDSLLAGRIDLEAIGALGFSVGGETAAELARRDTRCRAVAVIGLEPFWDYHLDSATVTKPILMALEEPVQEVSSGDIHINNPAYRLFGMAPGPAYYLRIGGTMHHSLTGVMRIVAPHVPGGDTDNRRAAGIGNASVVSFFNKHLLGQDDHLLDDLAARIPELVTFLSK